MEKEIVPHPLALRMRKIGFDEMCAFWCFADFPDKHEQAWNKNSCGWLSGDNCSLPTYSQCFRWFRDNYLLDGYPYNWKKEWNWEIVKLLDSDYTGTNKHHQWTINSREVLNKLYPKYEAAERALLEQLIEMVENNQN